MLPNYHAPMYAVLTTFLVTVISIFPVTIKIVPPYRMFSYVFRGEVSGPETLDSSHNIFWKTIQNPLYTFS
jgi:hypothetical protein